MENLKFDSIYKFMVSLGIILIILPFIIVYYFFEYNDVILLNEEDILKLTEISRNIVYFKQNFILEIINQKNIFITIFIIVELLGFILVIVGLVLWNKNVQNIENKKLMLDYKLQESNLTQLSINEKKNKVKEEIIGNTNDYKVDENQISEYIKAEEEIITNIYEVFKEYDLLKDVKIGKYSVDCLVPYRNPDNLLTKGFEIKYVRRKITMNYLNKVKLMMEEFAKTYYNDFSRFCLVCTIFVVDRLDNKFLLENKRVIDEIKEYNSNSHGNQICKMLIVDKNNIKEKIIKIKNNEPITY